MRVSKIDWKGGTLLSSTNGHTYAQIPKRPISRKILFSGGCFQGFKSWGRPLEVICQPPVRKDFGRFLGFHHIGVGHSVFGVVKIDERFRFNLVAFLIRMW
jgi:hypothetical protein